MGWTMGFQKPKPGLVTFVGLQKSSTNSPEWSIKNAYLFGDKVTETVVTTVLCVCWELESNPVAKRPAHSFL